MHSNTALRNAAEPSARSEAIDVSARPSSAAQNDVRRSAHASGSVPRI